jgi:hypothetical protein
MEGEQKEVVKDMMLHTIAIQLIITLVKKWVVEAIHHTNVPLLKLIDN